MIAETVKDLIDILQKEIKSSPVEYNISIYSKDKKLVHILEGNTIKES